MAAGGTISNLTALTAARERAVPGVALRRGRRAPARPLLLGRGALLGPPRRRGARASAGATCAPSAIDADRRMDPAACAAAIDADRRAGHRPGRGRRHRRHHADRRRRRPRARSPRSARRARCGCTSTAPTACRPRPPRSPATSSPGSTAPTRRPSTPTSGSTCRRRAACSWSATATPSKPTFTHDESYIPHTDREDAHPVDRTLEYSRPLSALKLWLAFRVHGAQRDPRRDRAQPAPGAPARRARPRGSAPRAARRAAALRGLLPPPAAAPRADPVAHNAALAAAISAEGRILLAPATVDGVPCLRACIVNHRTDRGRRPRDRRGRVRARRRGVLARRGVPAPLATRARTAPTPARRACGARRSLSARSSARR